MGDRNNPIKFGPEWLRNLARERSAGTSTTNSQNAAATSGNSSSGPPGAFGGAPTSTSSMTGNTSNTAVPKVLLAKLRYGREEMLALYERTSEAPQELKYIDILYQPRGKPPVALNNTFEDDMREAIRGGPAIGGGLSTGERFGIGRGMGRGQGVTEGRVEPGRGRVRLPFIRQLSAGRSTPWHVGPPKMPGYSGGADDDSTLAIRSWNSSNGGNATARTNSEQAEWTQNKMFRSKRPGSNTNWRSATRDDGEEWRALETSNRSRSNQQEKWERDWGDRPAQDKPQSWSTNRRAWVGGDTQNSDDNLPEWANENAEACSGTFDSSGAFHGYSNDDTNLPKSQDPAPYALTRSHTHGSFVRSKTAEEGSEEWWASEKAKILSPKRFDASEIKFNKKKVTGAPEVGSSTSSNNKQTLAKEDSAHNILPEKSDPPHGNTEPSESNVGGIGSAFNKKTVRFTESKTFDSLMRSDINMEEANDERCNFQSVMITPNNSLRQKHQNIVQSANNNENRQLRNSGVFQLLPNTSAIQNSESELPNHTPEENLVESIIIALSLEDKEILSNLATSSENPSVSISSPGKPSGMSLMASSMSQMSNPALQMRISSPVLPNQGLMMNTKPNIPAPGIQAPGIQNIGLTNSALNASLGLPIGNSNIAMGQTMGMPHGMPPPVLSNQGLSGHVMVGSGLQPGGTGMPDFQTNNNIPGMPSGNVANSSLFLRQNSNNSSLQSQNNIQMPNQGNQTNMFPMHPLQHSGSQASFSPSIYGNIMQQSSSPNTTNTQNLVEQWYYEDPKKIIQGPFSSKDMYNWYRAGFFSPSLMVRRACDAMMRPLGSYGPMVPFSQMELLSFPIASGYEVRNQAPHDPMLNSQPGLGLDIDSLWGQASTPPDLMWMQRAVSARNDTQVNHLPVFFWDQQPSTIAPNSLLPEVITKDTKTDEEILMQLSASRRNLTPPKVTFLNEPTPATKASNIKSGDTFTSIMNTTANLNEFQKLMHKDAVQDSVVGSTVEEQLYKEQKVKSDKPFAIEHKIPEPNNANSQVQSKIVESKVTKQPKTETDKAVKNKENNTTKTKNKKSKDDKKEELSECKAKVEDSNKVEKSSGESSPTKNKKELKKELEKEKKEWIKEGFTIVKGPEKSTRDIKKKLEELNALEDAERKRKEEERPPSEEETKRKPVEGAKKQEFQQQQCQISEAVAKKAPWSAVSAQAMQATSRDGMTLAEIQRLEREKKLEQMKEQQQMMQIIAQQQAAALAREQEMQAGLGWTKMKGNNLPGQHLSEIQAEARKQAVAAAAPTAASQAEEALTTPPLQVNLVPWNTQNGGGFWDTMPSSVKNLQELPTPVESVKIKKNVNLTNLTLPMKKDTSPAAEFETWCKTVLSVWDTKIDVPTFVGFLKDIESPYEVKDYVKYYLGDAKDSSDFARQFLERRSKLMRVGTVTPSDDLCSPAMAINPRTASSSDYQEIKGKGKKTKKNKMLKVDARILGFSVTAAEDRINVGDIDSV